MKVKGIILALALVAFLAPRASAQGTAAWTTGYPKTGNNNGGILVKGTTTPDAGWVIQPTGLLVIWPKNGGVLYTNATIPVNTTTGDWGESEVGAMILTSGAQYNVVVQINVKKCGVMATLSPPPAVATAK